MDQNDAIEYLNRLVDGQQVRIVTASGRTFDGVYDAECSGLEEGLYFETMEGKLLRAEWENVQQVSFRSARAMAGQIMVPPEHPLSGTGPVRMRAYTKRNPIPGAE